MRMQLSGTAGSLLVPDPNRFGGEVSLAKTAGEWQPQPHTHGNTQGEFRSIGVADMAAAIVGNRPHRASGALELDGLEAMVAVHISSYQGRRLKLEITVERPAMISPGLASRLMLSAKYAVNTR